MLTALAMTKKQRKSYPFQICPLYLQNRLALLVAQGFDYQLGQECSIQYDQM